MGDFVSKLLVRFQS